MDKSSSTTFFKGDLDDNEDQGCAAAGEEEEFEDDYEAEECRKWTYESNKIQSDFSVNIRKDYLPKEHLNPMEKSLSLK